MPTSGIPKNRSNKIINQCVFVEFRLKSTALSKATKRYGQP